MAVARTASTAEPSVVAVPTSEPAAFRDVSTATLAMMSPAATIKSGCRRTVTRERTASGAVYVKWYHERGAWAWWQRRFRGDPALREAQRLLQAQSRGIPVPELLDAGRKTAPDGRNASFLMTREIADAMPLRDLPPRTEFPGTAAPAIPQRWQLVERLGRLVGRLHAARLTHRDLHAGNVLVRLDADGWHAWLVDLMELRCHRTPITLTAAAENLSRLACSLHPWLSAIDYRRFWKAYAAERAAGGGFDVSAASALRFEAERRAFFERIWRQADRIWSRGNSKLLVTPHGRGLARLGTAALLDWQQRVHEFWRDGQTLRTSEPHARSIVLCTPDGVQPFRMVRVANGAAAQSAWETGHALRRRGVPAAVPWAIAASDSTTGWVLYRDPEECSPLSALRPTAGLMETVQRLLRHAGRLGFAWDCLSADDILLAAGTRWCGFRHPERLSLRRRGWLGRSAGGCGVLVWDSPATMAAASLERNLPASRFEIPVS